MAIPTDIKRFAKALQDENVGSDVYNFYHAARTNARRHNLQRYLTDMKRLHPDTLLVGEAPGYNGCARTGVPFSSEKLLREGVCGGMLFGAHNGYVVTDGDVRSEQSAKAMWEVLASLPLLPLLWNAYPFHPHPLDNPNANRKPRKSELIRGAWFLRELAALFAIERVIAVGNAAETMLSASEIVHEKVRHPAYGGKREFTEGLRSLLG